MATKAEMAYRERMYGHLNIDPATNPNVITVPVGRYGGNATVGIVFTEDDCVLIETALRWAAEHAPGAAGAELLEQAARFERSADRARVNGAKRR